jgi:hypothetical protein
LLVALDLLDFLLICGAARIQLGGKCRQSRFLLFGEFVFLDLQPLFGAGLRDFIQAVSRLLEAAAAGHLRPAGGHRRADGGAQR